MRRLFAALTAAVVLLGGNACPAGAAPPVPPTPVTSHWAKADIIDAYEMGLIDIWPEAPDAPVTRRQAAKLLADGVGLSPVEGDLPLTDVRPDDPDRPWFTALYMERIFRGDELGRFRPEEPLTRAEFAAIMARSAAGLLAEVNDGAEFVDMTGHWAAAEVAGAFRLGLVNGVGEGLFEPERSVTLAETLAMVVRMIDGSPAPGAPLATDGDLTGLAVLDLELWAKAYSKTPMPDWAPVYANQIGVALYITKESAAVEDAYRRQGHSGAASVLSSSARVLSSKPLSAVVVVESSGISVWDGVARQINDVSEVYLRLCRGRWMIYKSLGK